MESYKDWLWLAKQDLKLAELALKIDPTISIAIFHTQQCAEKALKGYLFFKNQTLQKTHDLSFLLELCSKMDSEFDDLREPLEFLNPFITASRYPGCRLEITSDIMATANRYAHTVLFFVQNKIEHTILDQSGQ